MGEIRRGDLFRDVRPPCRRWRVVGLGQSVLELACVEKPSLRRFQTADKLLDQQLYLPEPSVAATDSRSDDVVQAAAQPIRKVMIVLSDGRPNATARLGAAIARSLAADIQLALVQTTATETPCSIVASDSDRARILTEARIQLGLSFSTPASWEVGPVADAVAKAAKPGSPDLIVLGDGDGALVDSVRRSARCAVLVAPP